MNGKPMLWIDQYGQRLSSCTLRELQSKCGGGRVNKMYHDDVNGKTYHTGYVIGDHWFQGYVPMRKGV